MYFKEYLFNRPSVTIVDRERYVSSPRRKHSPNQGWRGAVSFFCFLRVLSIHCSDVHVNRVQRSSQLLRLSGPNEVLPAICSDVSLFCFWFLGMVQVRRISLDDKAKLKAFSIENDSAGWLKKKLFKKV